MPISDTEHPFNLALGLARIQQSLDRNPQIRLQDVHSRALFSQKGLSVTSRRRSLARRRPASIYRIRVEEFAPGHGWRKLAGRRGAIAHL